MKKVFDNMGSNLDPVQEKSKKHSILVNEGSFGSLESNGDGNDIVVRGKSKTPLVARTGLGQSILGPVDRRTEINDTTPYPWRLICSLEITDQNGEEYLGTGWIAGPRLIMTAGHCVYERRSMKGWAKTIKIYPGRTEDTPHDKAIIATEFKAPHGWIDNEDENEDYGAIILEEDISLSLGYFSVASLGEDGLVESFVNISGYPGSRAGEVQLHHANRILDVSSTKIYYDIDTEGGQSGSPIWIYKDNEQLPIVIGIHSNGAGKATLGNSGVRITQKLVKFIKEWSANLKE